MQAVLDQITCGVVTSLMPQFFIILHIVVTSIMSCFTTGLCGFGASVTATQFIQSEATEARALRRLLSMQTDMNMIYGTCRPLILPSVVVAPRRRSVLQTGGQLPGCAGIGAVSRVAVSPSKPGIATDVLRNVRAQGLVSPEVISQPFVLANSTVCIPWLMMILAPNWKVTQRVFKNEWSMIVPGIIFAFFFVAAAFIEVDTPVELLQKVKFLFIDAIQDPDKMRELLSSGPGYAAQDWIHLIAWDLIGGRWIYLDGLEKKVPTWHSLVITFGGGPLGLVLHYITRTFSRFQQQQ